MASIGEAERPSALALLEHVNLNVVDPVAAEAFFVSALGCVRNPKGSNDRQIHFNLGAFQFHMPFKLSVKRGEPVETPQVWPGELHLWVDDIAASTQRLQVAGLLSEEAGEPVIDWEGTPLRLVQAPVPSGTAPLGVHAGGTGHVLHLPIARHRIAPGTAEGLARWYRAMLAARVEVEELGREGLKECKVHFDCGDLAWPQVLVFEEDLSVPLPVVDEAYWAVPESEELQEIPEAQAYHICVYLESSEAFREAFDRAERAGLLFLNERFEGGPVEFASAATLEEAEEAWQFRVSELRDPVKGGRLLLRLEHEVRSPEHVSCPLKGPLVRGGLQPAWGEV